MSKLRAGFVSLLILVFIMCCASGDTVEDLLNKGYEALQANNYPVAFDCFKKASDLGNTEGLYMVGLCYFYGHGVEESKLLAETYMVQAAEQGLAEAQYNLANCYVNGYLGDQSSAEKAIKYYKMAAEQGHSEALFELGMCYLNGYGIDQSYHKAAEYLKMAADQGNTKGLNSLANLYIDGLGVVQSYEEAYRLFSLAVEKGDALAMNNLGTLFAEGLGVEQSHVKAFEYYEMSADLGNMYGQYNLGCAYYNGQGVKQSSEKAVEYFLMAADQGVTDAQLNVGICYEYGEGVEQSYAMAYKYYKMAADQGDSQAETYLNSLLEKGYDPKDLESEVKGGFFSSGEKDDLAEQKLADESAESITANISEQYVKTSDNVNCRVEPNKKSKLVKQLKVGTSVYLMKVVENEQGEQWAYVRVDDKYGYILWEYIDKEGIDYGGRNQGNSDDAKDDASGFDVHSDKEPAMGPAVFFLNIPWLSSVADVKNAVSDKLTKDLPSGEFEISDWNRLSYGDHEVSIKNIPIYTLMYEGRTYYKVADFNVAAITAKFVPTAADGTYSDTNFDDYAFVEAMYRFDADVVHNCGQIYNELIKKLTSLYGDPTEYYEENNRSNSVNFTFKANGCVWKRADDTFLELRWTYVNSSYTGKAENVYLTYAYTNEDYFASKQNAVLVSGGDSNIDVGSTDGL